MTQIRDAEQVASMAKELWETVLSHEASAAMVRKLGLSVFTEFTDPEVFLWINADEVITGEAARKDAVIQLKMTWEVGQALYGDQLGLTPAISSGKMKVKGPLLKLMKIVPLLQRAHTIWPDVCRKYGVDVS